MERIGWIVAVVAAAAAGFQYSRAEEAGRRAKAMEERVVAVAAENAMYNKDGSPRPEGSARLPLLHTRPPPTPTRHPGCSDVVDAWCEYDWAVCCFDDDGVVRR